jgi:hypothetical protein
MPPGADDEDAQIGHLGDWLPAVSLSRGLRQIGHNRGITVPKALQGDVDCDYSADRAGYMAALSKILHGLSWRTPIAAGGVLIREEDFHRLTVTAVGWHLDPVRWVYASASQVLRYLGVAEEHPPGFDEAWQTYADEIVPQMTRLIRGGLAIRIQWRADQDELQQAIRRTIRE